MGGCSEAEVASCSGRTLIGDSVASVLQERIEGFKANFGGEELKRATATLAGAAVGNALQATLGSVPGAEDLDYAIRELAFAAKQYADTTAGNPRDYDALYNHGLVLQELAGKMAASSKEQASFLQQACAKYQAAADVNPQSHSVLYNWGVALSDLARAVKDDDAEAARACLHLASQKYSSALQLHPHNPQALNNWGLVLGELSSDSPQPAERDALVASAVAKFRRALRMRPDFDRGCYNLGTVFYTYACALQAELSNQLKGGPGQPDALKQKQARDYAIRSLFGVAAQYICLALALQPHKDIYRKSLVVVKQMLPLPFLRAGYLWAPVGGPPGLTQGQGRPQEAWRRDWFVLDHLSLRVASAMEASLSTAGAGLLSSARGVTAAPEEDGPLVMLLQDMATTRRCQEPSLPAGHALWVSLENQPLGVYLVADSAQSADAWVDALVLAQHLVQTRSSEALADALAPSTRRGSARSSALVGAG